MANQLTMADIQAILTLHKRGWRNRRIARELNVDRETVAKYIRASAWDSKPAKAPIGSDPKPANAPLGSEIVSAPLDQAPASLEAAGFGGISGGSVSLEKECGRSAC